MTGYKSLLDKIKSKQAQIGIIGMGYVGLPLALLFAKRGYQVVGFVRNEKRKLLLESGKSNLADEDIDSQLKECVAEKKFRVELNNKDELSKMDVLIVCVPTPVTEGKIPDLTDLKEVAKLLSTVDLNNKLVINESTVAPFTTSDVFSSLKNCNFLVCSPERVDPGNKGKNTQNIPKVLGGKNTESTELGKTLYENILDEKVVTVSSMEAAEMAKMLENTYRAVNIALINEFAKLADALKLDILEIIDAAKTKWSFQAHYPGIGVGGHCIPVDPYYILSLAKSKNVSMKVVEDGLLENEEMAEYVATKVSEVFEKGMKVLVYGITYKKDINDVRESPVTSFGLRLQKKGIPFTVYDPFVASETLEKMGFNPGELVQADIFIVGTDHSSLAEDYKKAVHENTIVIDGRNYFKQKVGKLVYGVGRTLL